ncbi:MAG: type II toxin-antitoxin system VapC family toxin [Terracidiphilus sp.]|jgi:tRNA(fMet)-specific endonuclease VapC
MKSLYMLDTNMVSYIAKGHSKAARARMLNVEQDEIVCLSAITEAEIRYGLAKRPEAAALRERMEWFLAAVKILPWGRDEAKAYGALRARLESSGKTLENMDMQIAAHAIATGAVLVTNDKAFAQVDDLQATVNWATDLP